MKESEMQKATSQKSEVRKQEVKDCDRRLYLWLMAKKSFKSARERRAGRV